MKIAIFAPLLGVEATGQSMAVASTANRLSDAGHTVTVIATDCGYQGRLVSQFVAMAPEVAVHIFPSIGSLNRRLYRSPQLELWIALHVDEFDLLDIHGIWSYTGIVVARVFHARGKPYTLTPHGTMTRYDWRKGAVRRRLFFFFGFAKIWQEADVIRFLSQGEADASYFPAKGLSAVIPNGVDLQPDLAKAERNYARAHLGLPSDAAILLFLGRITHQKGVKETLAAFELAAKANDNLYLLLAGPSEGTYGEEVIARVQKSLFQKRIVVPGAVLGDTKADYFLAADAFISLSHNEGMSLALLEALSYGLPLIITESSNLNHFKEYGAGIITNHESGEAAQDILRLTGDHALREQASQQARRLVEEKFQWNNVLPQLVALYQKLLDSKI